MAKDMEQMVLDDETLAEMASAWYDDNVELFEEVGLGPEEGWVDEPPEELDQLAQDAAVDIIDQLRSPEDGSGGIAVLNERDDVANTLFFALAQITAATPEDYEAWYDSLAAEVEVEDADEVEDEFGDVGDEPEVDYEE